MAPVPVLWLPLAIQRDQPVPGNPTPIGNIPSFDLTLNYIPITSPTDPNSNNFVPPILKMHTKEIEFWRVSNSTADVNLDLQYVFDGVPQTMKRVAIDGVPSSSGWGRRHRPSAGGSSAFSPPESTASIRITLDKQLRC